MSVDHKEETAGTSFSLLSVLMPIYNERHTLAEIIRRVLASPVGLPLEIVAVDDGSRDGSWPLLEELAAADARIKPFRHEHNLGKGAAVRTAISRMSGDVAVVQDADLEYDPREYPRLLAPILAGEADAVYGSRFALENGLPVQRTDGAWHRWGNQALTWLSNRVHGMDLSDMETCYKMVRADVLRRLPLTSQTFTIEPELTCRLAQSGARIREVPISYRWRNWEEGKKIGPLDGVKALWAIVRFRFSK